MVGIRINLTDREAASESLEPGPLPKGKYLCSITECEQEVVKNPPKDEKKRDNRGEPYYHFEFTVQDGEYNGRKMYCNAMLFDGANYTVVQMLKALGIVFRGSDFQVPDYEPNTVPEPGWWLGKSMVVYGQVRRGTIKDKETGERYNDKTEPNGFWAASTWKGAPASTASTPSKANSLLP